LSPSLSRLLESEPGSLSVKNLRDPTAASVRGQLSQAQTAYDLPVAITHLARQTIAPAEQHSVIRRVQSICRKVVEPSQELVGVWSGWRPQSPDHRLPIGGKPTSQGRLDRSGTLVIVSSAEVIIARTVGSDYGVYPLLGGSAAITNTAAVPGPHGLETSAGIELVTTAGTLTWRCHPFRHRALNGEVEKSLPSLLLILVAGAQLANEPRVEGIASANPNTERPGPRLIRSPHEAEQVVAEWMGFMGFTNARPTPVGRDEGIDVRASDAIAQVKMEGVPTGRPVVQQLYGVATAETSLGLLFSLAGYTQEAISWANRVKLPLFRFNLQGEPEAANHAARELVPDNN
jgi:hypothetical protein